MECRAGHGLPGYLVPNIYTALLWGAVPAAIPCGSRTGADDCRAGVKLEIEAPGEGRAGGVLGRVYAAENNCGGASGHVSTTRGGEDGG